MTDAIGRAVAAWKRGMTWLAAAWRCEMGERRWWEEEPPRARASAHARLAADCMRADILVEYVPGRRVVTDGKIGSLTAESIVCHGVDPFDVHEFHCRPVNVDWRGKDAIGWGYDL